MIYRNLTGFLRRILLTYSLHLRWTLLHIDCNKSRDGCIIGGGDRNSWWPQKRTIAQWSVGILFLLLLFYVGASYSKTGNFRPYDRTLMHISYLVHLTFAMFVILFCVLIENWIKNKNKFNINEYIRKQFLPVMLLLEAHAKLS